MNEDDLIFIDDNDVIEYIQEELIGMGIIVDSSDIELVLDLYMKYMIEMGFAVPYEEDDNEDD